MSEIHDLRDDAALEALVRVALDRSGEPAPFEVNVADAVMARVARIGPAPTTELGWRQLTRWAIAAAAIGVALLSAAAFHGPSLGDVALELGRTTADTVGTAAKLSEPAATVAGATGRSAVALLEAARTLARPLESLRPLVQLLLAIVSVAMVGLTALVVGRDLRAMAPRKEQA